MLLGRGDTHGIDGSTRDIQYALQNKPGEAHLSLELSDTKQRNAVQNWDNSTCTHGDKHACPEWTPFGGSEIWHNGYGRAADTDEGDL